MICSALLGLALLFPFQEHDLKASPFDGLRWTEGRPEVQVAVEWYRPLAIDGLSLEELLDAIDSRWPGQREKRFAEDLVEALDLLSWEGDLFVDLDLVRLSDRETVRLESVEMTRAKRDALRDSANANRVRSTRPLAPIELDRESLDADLEAFQAGLERRFAYLSLRDVPVSAALDQIRAQLDADGSISTVEVARALHRLLMQFPDGHARVSAPADLDRYTGRHTPFLLCPSNDGTVAVDPERTSLVDPARPFVVAIDGRPLAEWIDAASLDVVEGSPQAIHFRSVRALRQIERYRPELGIEPKAPLTLTLSASSGADARDLELSLQDQRPLFGTWPSEPSRLLEGDLGYLRIPAMDDKVGAVRSSMKQFKDTRGLIVDVRANGGGSREILLALAGYLIGPQDSPVVANIAAYRDGGDFPTDHLAARYMYEASWEGWSPEQRSAIATAAASFEPEWAPERPMSPWHYLLLDRTGHPDEYHYERPVIVLSDAGCFSATDIFLGALELLPNVTLMGTASSGGSARTQRFRLPNSGIEVRCASMASYRPDGRLYDGRGIEVDVEVLPEPTDFVHGGGDAVLSAAIARLRSPR